MELDEERIKELMTTVACASCGSSYQYGNVEVLGHRDALWFLRVSCVNCATRGLIAALIKASEVTTVESQAPLESNPSGIDLDRLPAGEPVTRADVRGMRHFLNRFDGDFKILFGSDEPEGPDRPAA